MPQSRKFENQRRQLKIKFPCILTIYLLKVLQAGQRFERNFYQLIVTQRRNRNTVRKMEILSENNIYLVINFKVQSGDIATYKLRRIQKAVRILTSAVFLQAELLQSCIKTKNCQQAENLRAIWPFCFTQILNRDHFEGKH